jgi:predicted NAD/FAD-dependent oxidoreductase
MTSFWVTVGEDHNEKCLADVGAQVISMRSPARLPSWLKSMALPAQEAGLAQTDERIAEWFHFFAPAGLPALQRRSLEEAQPDELHYNRRVVELVLLTDRGFPKRWRASYSGEQGGRRPVGFEDFDVVVFAGTAADALNLRGLQAELTSAQLQLLRSVRYDHRLCVALVFQPELASALEKLCEGKAERSFGEDSGSPISLVARQEVKGRACSSACSVVLHSTTRFAAQNLQAAKNQNRSPSDLGKQQLLLALSNLLALAESLPKALLDSKVVHWRQCQVRTSPKRQRAQSSCCAVGTTPQLFLAGDFLAQPDVAGSFEGCLESAESAAKEVCGILLPTSEAADVAPSADNVAIGYEGAAIDDGLMVQGRWRSSASKCSSVGNSEKQESMPPRRNRNRRWQAKD